MYRIRIEKKPSKSKLEKLLSSVEHELERLEEPTPTERAVELRNKVRNKAVGTLQALAKRLEGEVD